VPEARDEYVQSLRRREASAEGQAPKKNRDGSKREGRKRELPVVWLEDDGFVRPVHVQTGLTDGTRVEVIGDELKEGMRIVVGELRQEEETTTKNPFLPKMFRGNSRPREQKQ